MARNWFCGKYYCIKSGPNHYHSSQSEADRCDREYEKEQEYRREKERRTLEHSRQESIDSRQERKEMRAHEEKMGKLKLKQMKEMNKWAANQRALGFGGGNGQMGFPQMNMLEYNPLGAGRRHESQPSYQKQQYFVTEKSESDSDY